MTQMPAITLVATPGRRARMVELCREAEKRGFAGIYVPSLAAATQFCQSVLEATSTIEVATSIQPIYYINPREMARIAAYLHEVGNGRFRLGIGVSHEVSRVQYGVEGRISWVKFCEDVPAEITGDSAAAQEFFAGMRNNQG